MAKFWGLSSGKNLLHANVACDQLVCCLHRGLVILLILIEFVGLAVKTIKVIILKEGKN